jgi:hypothetical protein
MLSKKKSKKKREEKRRKEKKREEKKREDLRCYQAEIFKCLITSVSNELQKLHKQTNNKQTNKTKRKEKSSSISPSNLDSLN